MSEIKHNDGGNNDEPVHTSADYSEDKSGATAQQAWRSSKNDVSEDIVASTRIQDESKAIRPNPATDEIVVILNQSWRQLVGWLSIKFPRVPAEDLIQDALLKLWAKGPGILNLFRDHDGPRYKVADNDESESSFQDLLIRRFKRMLYCRTIDYVRSLGTIGNGGNYIHVDIDNLKDCIPSPSGLISVTECAETLSGLTEWLRGKLSTREEIVAAIYLLHLPERSTVDEIYDEISSQDRMEFLPRNGRILSEKAARDAVKSQISRSRSSLEGKLREFSKTQ